MLCRNVDGEISYFVVVVVAVISIAGAPKPDTERTVQAHPIVLPKPLAGQPLRIPQFGWTEPTQVDVGDRIVRLTALSRRPVLFRVEELFTRAEVDEVIRHAESNASFRGSTADGDSSSRLASRVGSAIRKDVLGADPVVHKLTKRVAKILEVPVEAVEGGWPLQINRYGVGGKYDPHYDGPTLEDLDPAESIVRHPIYDIEVHGSYPHATRLATLLCTLEQAVGGGETAFPLAQPLKEPVASGLQKNFPDVQEIFKVESQGSGASKFWEKWLPVFCNATGSRPFGIAESPLPGSCLLWYNHVVPKTEAGLLGQFDQFSLHAGCRVTKGQKLVMNWWIEMRPPFNFHLGWDEL